MLPSVCEDLLERVDVLLPPDVGPSELLVVCRLPRGQRLLDVGLDRQDLPAFGFIGATF